MSDDVKSDVCHWQPNILLGIEAWHSGEGLYAVQSVVIFPLLDSPFPAPREIEIIP